VGYVVIYAKEVFKKLSKKIFKKLKTRNKNNAVSIGVE
jgi:hypothetical protein